MAVDAPPTGSSCFSRLLYDTATSEVVMMFIKGGMWTIQNFPAEEWAAWKASGSLGGYFNSNIRGNY